MHNYHAVSFMIGVAGFEPTTSPTPRVRATWLRYTPMFNASCWSYYLRFILINENPAPANMRLHNKYMSVSALLFCAACRIGSALELRF